MTVEDPIEYELPDANQSEVDEKGGLTFARGLRTILRCDPDVLLVGEIRDAETAAIATQAAMTGHLVLTSLHAHTAAGAIARLREMDVAPGMLASTLNLIVAQRLARKLCERLPRRLRSRARHAVARRRLQGMRRHRIPRPRRVLRAAADPRRGRSLVEDSAEQIFAAAVAQGMRTLREDGMRLCLGGLSTVDEIRRVTGDRLSSKSQESAARRPSCAAVSVAFMAKAAVQYACSSAATPPGAGSASARAAARSGRSPRRRSPRPPRAAGRAAAAPARRRRGRGGARIGTGVAELDRVLGGGLVPASLVLVGGEPGVGKSTLLLTALAAISKDRRALLVTGEESTAQVKLRAQRLGGAEGVEILAETELETVCATLERERPDVCVIDSVQTLYSSELGSAPGSVAQVREAAARLLRVAKESGVATILVGHVTKDGAVAGPRVLEHLVDCVLQFEGDRYHAHRVLRAAKNRFGSTNELGVFEMTGAGLVGVPDPSELFGRTVAGEPGSARRVRARGHAADPARGAGARRADRPRDAAPRRDGRRPEAARDDRRGALAARRASRSARPTSS